MGLWVPTGPRGFGWHFTNDDTGPGGSSSRGVATAVTNGTANVKNAWTEIISGAQCARDVFGLMLCFNSTQSSGQISDSLADIGVDPSGGSSYTVLIPDLLMTACELYSLTQQGVWYYFPIWIKAGSSIACRSACNSGVTPFGPNVLASIYGSPLDESSARVGTYVFSCGVVSASSAGTTITSGTTSEGAWTTLATSTAKAAWWWQVGMGINDSTMGGVLYHLDVGVGDASNKQVVIADKPFMATSLEAVSSRMQAHGCRYPAKAGVNVYGRMQCSGTADSALSMAAYGLGG